MCYCTPNIRTPYCQNCPSYMRTELESLREQLENMMAVVARIENERNACLEELHAISEALGTSEGHSSVYWIEQLKAALKTYQEPFAWYWKEKLTLGHRKHFTAYKADTDERWTPLYTHPARTLSDEEIELIWNMTEFHGSDDWNAALEFARAVLEKANE